MAPLTTTVMNSVEKSQVGIASGVNNAISRVAGLIAIAVFGLLMSSVFNRQLDAKLAPLGHQAKIDRSKLAGAAVSGPEGVAVKASFVGGFRAVMWLGAGLALPEPFVH